MNSEVRAELNRVLQAKCSVAQGNRESKSYCGRKRQKKCVDNCWHSCLEYCYAKTNCQTSTHSLASTQGIITLN